MTMIQYIVCKDAMPDGISARSYPALSELSFWFSSCNALAFSTSLCASISAILLSAPSLFTLNLCKNSSSDTFGIPNASKNRSPNGRRGSFSCVGSGECWACPMSRVTDLTCRTWTSLYASWRRAQVRPAVVAPDIAKRAEPPEMDIGNVR